MIMVRSMKIMDDVNGSRELSVGGFFRRLLVKLTASDSKCQRSAREADKGSLGCPCIHAQVAVQHAF